MEKRLLLDSTLKEMGFHQLQNDKCVYKIKKLIDNIECTLFLSTHVDDILCLGINKPILVFNSSKIIYQLRY